MRVSKHLQTTDLHLRPPPMLLVSAVSSNGPQPPSVVGPRMTTCGLGGLPPSRLAMGCVVSTRTSNICGVSSAQKSCATPGGRIFRESNWSNAGSPIVCLPESKPKGRRTVDKAPSWISSTSGSTPLHPAPGPPTASYEKLLNNAEQSKGSPLKNPKLSFAPSSPRTGPSNVTITTPPSSHADTGLGKDNSLQMCSPGNSSRVFFILRPTW
mmetsp:Transcript_18930/g.54826  ORF Transcript_18930/g.54826 Transcript_18930/m.54826 type:complete len:211 (-) Transcript_18930:705-1337(-)